MVCSKCGECCKYIFFTFNKFPLSKDQKRYFKYRGVEFIDNGNNTVTAQIYTPCKHLTKDNLCSIFETRPDVCKEKSSGNVKIHRMKNCTDG